LVLSAALNPDASLLAAGIKGGSMMVLEVETGKRRYVRKAHGLNTLNVEFSPSGLRLASAGPDSRICIWSTESGDLERVLGPTQDMPLTLAFGASDDRLTSGHEHGRIRHWNLESGACDWMTSGPISEDAAPDGMMGLALSNDGGLIYGIGSRGVHVRTARLPIPVVLHHSAAEYPYAYDVDFSPSGRHLVSAGWDGTVRIWDVATGQPVVVLPCPASAFWARYSPDGRRLLVSSQQGYYSHRITSWNLSTLRKEGELDANFDHPSGIFVPRSGVVLLGVQAELWLVDPVTLEVRETRPFSPTVRSLALSPDGMSIACGTSDGACTILDSQSLDPLLRMEGHENDVEALAFSPDGERLATGARDATILIWDVRSGEERLKIDSPEGRRLFSIRFTKDGRRILTGSRYPAIRVWDATTGRELLQLAGHDNYVHGLAFSPDGRILASASGDNTVRLWDSRPLAERMAERDRVLAAELAQCGRVERLFELHGSFDGVVDAIEAESSLGPLEKHAAWNVAARFQRQG
jgi:WD40 repeat protein